MWGRSLYLRCHLRRGDVNNGRLAAINISNEDTFALSVARSGTKSPAKAADQGPAAPHRLLMLISAHTNLTVALGCDGVTLVISLKVAVRYCEICTVVAMSFVGGAISTFIIYKMVFIDLFGG